MKPTSRSKSARSRTTQPSADQIRHYLQCLEQAHQEAWHAEIQAAAPHWEFLISVHLRLIELEQMEQAVEEFL